jgi:hypothetical protein
MKTRIFSVFGLLVLCAVLSTGGSRAWAATSTATLNGPYSCVFAGSTGTPFVVFNGSGVLDVINGELVVSPNGSQWVWDIAGVGLIDIALASGTFTASPNGQATLSLVWIPPAPPIPNLGLPLEFNNNVVMSNIDSGGTAHTFVATLQPPPTFDFLVSTMVCEAQSLAVGNPNP